MQNKKQLARIATLTGYFGLLGFLMLWLTVLSPSEKLPVALTLLVMVTPLLFPLRGILNGRAYTHAWASMLSLGYFTLAVGMIAGEADERIYGIIQLILSLLMFLGCMMFARYQGKEDKLKQEQEH